MLRLFKGCLWLFNYFFSNYFDYYLNFLSSEKIAWRKENKARIQKRSQQFFADFDKDYSQVFNEIDFLGTLVSISIIVGTVLAGIALILYLSDLKRERDGMHLFYNTLEQFLLNKFPNIEKISYYSPQSLVNTINDLAKTFHFNCSEASFEAALNWLKSSNRFKNYMSGTEYIQLVLDFIKKMDIWW